jgi:hypothetical protein
MYGRMRIFLLNKNTLTCVTNEVQENNNKYFTRIYIYEMRSLMRVYMSTLLDGLQGHRVNIIKRNTIKYCHVYE